MRTVKELIQQLQLDTTDFKAVPRETIDELLRDMKAVADMTTPDDAEA